MFIKIEARRQVSQPQSVPAELADKTTFELGKLGWFEVVEPETLPSFDPDTEYLHEFNYDLDFNAMQAVKVYTVELLKPAMQAGRCPTCLGEWMESDEENRTNNVVKMSMAAGTLKTADTI